MNEDQGIEFQKGMPGSDNEGSFSSDSSGTDPEEDRSIEAAPDSPASARQAGNLGARENEPAALSGREFEFTNDLNIAPADESRGAFVGKDFAKPQKSETAQNMVKSGSVVSAEPAANPAPLNPFEA